MEPSQNYSDLKDCHNTSQARKASCQALWVPFAHLIKLWYIEKGPDLIWCIWGVAFAHVVDWLCPENRFYRINKFLEAYGVPLTILNNMIIRIQWRPSITSLRVFPSKLDTSLSDFHVFHMLSVKLGAKWQAKNLETEAHQIIVVILIFNKSKLIFDLRKLCTSLYHQFSDVHLEPAASSTLLIEKSTWWIFLHHFPFEWLVQVNELSTQIVTVEFWECDFRVFNKKVCAVHYWPHHVSHTDGCALVGLCALRGLQTECLRGLVPVLVLVPLCLLNSPIEIVVIPVDHWTEQEVRVDW